MMLSGAAHRYCGAAGAAEERLFLLTFHHSCAVPSGGVQMRFQSKGFSLVERHLYGGIRRLGSKLTGEYADYFEPEPEK